MAFVDPNNEIRILTPNFIDSNSDFTLSHGGDSAKLYDKDNDSKYITVGAGRDNITANIEITFKIDGVETEMTLNALIMINHNLKDWKFYTWDAGTSSWDSKITEDSGSVDINCFTMGAIKTSRIKLEMNKTIQPNRQKEMGELIIARQRFTITRRHEFEPSQQNFRETFRDVLMGDGSVHRAMTKFSPNRTQKYQAVYTFNFLDNTDFETLQCIKEEAQEFLFYPESVTRAKELFLVHWVNPFNWKYTIHNKASGKTVTMQVREV